MALEGKERDACRIFGVGGREELKSEKKQDCHKVTNNGPNNPNFHHAFAFGFAWNAKWRRGKVRKTTGMNSDMTSLQTPQALVIWQSHRHFWY